jgi:ABC-type phosphate transport system permease subunit
MTDKPASVSTPALQLAGEGEVCPLPAIRRRQAREAVEATRPLLYATVFVLLALTFALNLVAIAIRTHTRRKAAAGH